ncbi:MAG TPA: hypothetical protein VN745_08775 [Verrucomicrobiae bacterium]|nr:hypothetical protein [Verrucomicrobiae bacterium]
MPSEPVIHTEGVRHEIRDTNIPALTAFGVAIVLTIAATMLFCFIVFRIYQNTMPMGPPAAPYASSRQLPPEPRLQTSPRMDLEDYLNTQRHELGGYNWVDRPNGVVRIPVERAMELLLKQGFPVRPATGSSQAARLPDGYSPPAVGSRAKHAVARHSAQQTAGKGGNR